MVEIIHNIDLSSVPHREGQSTDLEAKRQRAWGRLSDEEKEWVIGAWDLTGMIPSAPAFREMKSAGDRVLYVLVGTEESLTPLELCYLMIARWFRNIDPATARAKMAQLVSQGYARYTGVGRTMATEAGLEALEELRSRRRRTSEDEEDEERRSDHRQTTSRTRIVDRGESAKSSFGNRAAPTGRYRSEIPDDGGRPGRRDDSRGGSRGDGESGDREYRGRDSFNSRGERRDGQGARRDSRGGDRDDRRGDSRGPRSDDRDRGGYSRGPRRDDRRDARHDGGGRDDRRDDRRDGGGRDDRRGDSRDNRGPRRDDRRGGGGRDDRRGDSRGPRRDDRGGHSRGPRRDDRSGGSRGPRRDDRRGGSRDRGRGRNDRGGAPERRRMNTDGPVIDGRQPMERRVNTDGPVIDGRDKKPDTSSED